MRRGERLLQVALAHEDVEPLGEVLNDLLREFFHGYPVRRLRLLLTSEKLHLRAGGMFIASELTKLARPILPEVLFAAAHDQTSAWIRSGLVELALTCPSDLDVVMIRRALSHINDVNIGVRMKVNLLLSRCEPSRLRTVERFPTTNERLKSQLAWFLSLSEKSSPDEITERLNSKTLMTRAFAVAAATKVYESDRRYLERAARSRNPWIAMIARHEIWVWRLRNRKGGPIPRHPKMPRHLARRLRRQN